MSLLQRLFRPFQARRVVIPDPLWDQVVAHYPFLARQPADKLARVRQLADAFLAHKSITGAQGFEPDDLTRVAIAAQACLLIHADDLSWYRRFAEVIVYPDEFVVQRSDVDDAGVVTEWEDSLEGEAWDGGPVVLSWRAITSRGDDGKAVVLHEFAHHLDMIDGDTDGVPAFAGSRRAMSRQRWQSMLTHSYNSFCDHLDALDATLPANLSPEDDAAKQHYEPLGMDPYAATDEAEFFAVATETYFLAPDRLSSTMPSLFEALRQYYE